MQMKFRFQYLAFIFTTSVISTFMMHAYLYYNHERMKYRLEKAEKLSLRNISKNLMGDFDATPKQHKNIPVDYDYHKIEIQQQICKHNNSKLLGTLNVNASFQPIEAEVEKVGVELIEGCFQPKHCRSVQKVAIVVPYKNRYHHLLTLLFHLNPILQRQNIMYCIFVAEQFDDGSFNKARIMNAVFNEISSHWSSHQDQLSRPFDCFVFHDVDMLPENDFNLYLCEDMPKHLSPAIDKFNYTTGYGTKYGGVTAMSEKNYRLVNGHSNRFWGWGGEDNDMEERINKTGLVITSVNETIGRYKMIPHKHPWWFSPMTGVGSSYRKLPQSPTRNDKEEKPKEDISGLSDIEYYVMGVQKTKLWNKITLDIRTLELENATVNFANNKGRDVNIYSMAKLNILRTSSSDIKPTNQEQMDDALSLPCVPTYYKFDKMTINRTSSMDDKIFTHIYHDLEEAKNDCTKMQTGCHAIVEQVKDRYSLRKTAFVQENQLHYKYGLSEQYDVYERHYSTAVYVKLCPGDPRYLQFFPTPIMLYGDAERGPAPRYHVDIFLSLFHPTNATFAYETQMMSSHRAIMEERLMNKLIPRPWWDSLSKIQFSKTTLVRLGEERSFGKFTVKTSNSSRLLHIRSPVNGLLREPGCYVVKNRIIDETSHHAVLEWNWWFQLHAETQEIEEKMKEKMIQKSMESGRQFNKMMYEKRSIMEKWAEKKRQEKLEKKREILRHQRPAERKN